jgi:hypothetical protein
VAVGPSLPAASAPYLLHVVLNALWYVQMDDTLQIREIKTHSQRNRGNHNLYTTLSKLFQGLRFLLIAKGGMVNGCRGRNRIGDIVEYLPHNMPSSCVDQDTLAFAYQRIVEVSDQ